MICVPVSKGETLNSCNKITTGFCVNLANEFTELINMIKYFFKSIFVQRLLIYEIILKHF